MLLHQFMEFYAQDIPTSPCVEMGSISYSYDKANKRCNQMAHAFLRQGLAKGDRLAWIGKNSIEIMFLFYAGSKVGVVPTPLNYRLAPPEWAYIVNDCAAKVLVCEAEFCAGIDKVRDKLTNVEHFICLDVDLDSDLDVGLNSNLDDGLHKKGEGWTSFEDWVNQQPDNNPNHTIYPDDDLYQMYTSGTTGLPKGAVISQYAVETNTRLMCMSAPMDLYESRVVLPLPMYHAAAGITFKAAVSMGGSIIIHKEFCPLAVVADMEQKGVTNATLVPAMLQACLVNVPDIENKTFPKLRYLGYGASPIAEDTLKKAMRVFGCQFAQAFGMTETTAVATQLTVNAHERAVNGEPHLLLSCGRAAAGTEVRIVDEDHCEVARGVVGEIAVRGPQLMKQYWNLPEATAKTLIDGWLYTGDAARMDEEGFVYIQDRIKDMIVSGGENVYPKEIENALFDHDNIADAAVIGVPDEKYGEAILAFVQTCDGNAIDSEALIAFCRERLAGYKVPRQYEFIAEIPRNASGKVLKKDLREPYWEGVERRVG